MHTHGDNEHLLLLVRRLTTFGLDASVPCALTVTPRVVVELYLSLNIFHLFFFDRFTPIETVAVLTACAS